MIDRESNGRQVKTAGGGVLADNGAWHAFTVAGSPALLASAGVPPRMTSTSAGRLTGHGRQGLWAVAGLTGLALSAWVVGPRRRRRMVVAGVVVCVLSPVTALAQTSS